MKQLDTDPYRKLWTAVFLDLISEIQTLRILFRSSMNGKCAYYLSKLELFREDSLSADFGLICELIGKEHSDGINLLGKIIDGEIIIRIPYKFSDGRCNELSNEGIVGL